jgi:uncharacterized membrane protein (Fun14 family)
MTTAARDRASQIKPHAGVYNNRMTKDQRLVWGVTGLLGVIYLVGFALGWAERAPWHLLLVIIAILFLFGVFITRK